MCAAIGLHFIGAWSEAGAAGTACRTSGVHSRYLKVRGQTEWAPPLSYQAIYNKACHEGAWARVSHYSARDGVLSRHPSSPAVTADG